VVGRSNHGETPKMGLSDKGCPTLPDYFNPEKFWNMKWNGIWYLFVYDVPEVDRKYRDVLRRFLRQLRMGCLQQSVWVTPNDIRPQFDDLAKGAGVDSFAYLFESKTVLRLPNRRVVEDAWNFRKLYEIHTCFCKTAEANLDLLSRATFDEQELISLLRISLNAFHSAFVNDPLLPRKLWPYDYRGEEAFGLHRDLVSAINHQLHV
jgi:phenylacetic acid degradation operon negative regulatory protein